MTIREVADHLHFCPGLLESFVFEQHFSIEVRGPKGVGNGTARCVRYRIMLRGDHGLADWDNEDLGEALRGAFNQINLPMPAALAEAFDNFN
jgi:hypothetical protein